MIFATVGTQLPFPRLMRALDGIAIRHGLRIVAQSHEILPGMQALEQRAFVAPAEFDELTREARIIVGHAGIGTIIGAARVARPLVLYPRRASLGEHRNEHQLATAQAMAERTGICVAWDDSELERLLTAAELVPLRQGDSPTRPALIAEIAGFIAG